MKKNNKILLAGGGVIVAGAIAAFMFMSPATAAIKLDIKGSTSVEPFVKALKEENMDKYKIQLSAQGSGTGISALFDGKTDIAMSSRDLKPEEQVKAQNLGIEKTEVAKDGISIVVNKSLNLKNITSEQLKKIYAGEIKNWSEIDPKLSGEINVVARDEASGTREGFDKLIGLKSLVKDAKQIEATGEVVRTVEENKTAIGYVSSGTNLKDLKVLNVDGVEETTTNIKSAKYKLFRSFYLLNKKSNKNAHEFVNYALEDKQQDLLVNAKHKTNFIKIK